MQNLRPKVVQTINVTNESFFHFVCDIFVAFNIFGNNIFNSNGRGAVPLSSLRLTLVSARIGGLLNVCNIFLKVAIKYRIEKANNFYYQVIY